MVPPLSEAGPNGAALRGCSIRGGLAGQDRHHTSYWLMPGTEGGVWACNDAETSLKIAQLGPAPELRHLPPAQTAVENQTETAVGNQTEAAVHGGVIEGNGRTGVVDDDDETNTTHPAIRGGLVIGESGVAPGTWRHYTPGEAVERLVKYLSPLGARERSLLANLADRGMTKEPAALPWMQAKKATAASANNPNASSANASSANATLKGSNTSSGGVSSADSEKIDAARADVAGAGVAGAAIISSKSPAAHEGISLPARGPRRGVGDVVFALLRDVASEDDPDGARVFKGWYPCVVRGTQNDSVSFVSFTTVCLSVILTFFLLFSTQPRNTTLHNTT